MKLLVYMYVVNKLSLFVLLFIYCCSWPEVKLSQFYLKNLLSDAGSRVVLYIFFVFGSGLDAIQ